MTMSEQDKREISLEAYINEQVEEINSDFNRWVTAEKLGRDPTRTELAANYIKTGGAKRHAQKHNRDIKGADL